MSSYPTVRARGTSFLLLFRIRFDEARIQLDEPITRAELDRFSRPLLDALDEAVAGLLERAGVAEPAIDAVFLTGGSSQIPAVRQLFVERFGDDRLRSADAFASVAEGLGRAAGAVRPA